MTKVFYIIAILSLIISFFKSKEKTKMVLKKAWKSFENIMPQFLAIILVIGIMLGLLHFLIAHMKSAEKNFFFSALFF